ncbi:hypothetical protein COOONC_00133 [Cooperia oncophora]
MAYSVTYVGILIISLCGSSAIDAGDLLQQRTGGYEMVLIHEVSDLSAIRRISFTAFGRSYVAVLAPTIDILDPYAQIKISDRSPLPLDPSDHYRGYLEGLINILLYLFITFKMLLPIASHDIIRLLNALD